MKKVEFIELFFEEHIFEEQLIIAFYHETDAFTIIIENPIFLNLPKNSKQRGFIKLSFCKISNYKREKGVNKLYDINDIYFATETNGLVDVRELTVGYEEYTNRKSFYLDMGISYGRISFYFEDLYTEEKILSYKKEKDTFIYFDIENNEQVDFYNLFYRPKNI